MSHAQGQERRRTYKQSRLSSSLLDIVVFEIEAPDAVDVKLFNAPSENCQTKCISYNLVPLGRLLDRA